MNRSSFTAYAIAYAVKRDTVLTMPSKAELIELCDLLMTHALGFNPEKPKDRQQCALNYVFQLHIEKGVHCKCIETEKILTHCPGKGAAESPKEAVHNLMRQVGLRLEAFYGDGHNSGEEPHVESHRAKYRPNFTARGNYALKFELHHAKKAAPEWVSEFWKPHLPPKGMAKILYVEPLFMMDERRTFYRNADMGTQPDVSCLSYLPVAGSLKPGYSYVPSGVVQALLLLTKAIRHANNQSPDVPCYEALKPLISEPPSDCDLIVLATPTTTELVKTLQDGLKMKVSRKGVHYKGKPKNDTEKVQWGVVSRLHHKHHVVTMITAKHGRSIEAMAQFLTLEDKLASILKWMNRPSFPESFQVMFRMPVSNTREGPSVRDAAIADVFVSKEPILKADTEKVVEG